MSLETFLILKILLNLLVVMSDNLIQIKPHLPLLFLPPPTPLDTRQGRLLSGVKGDHIRSDLTTFATLPRNNYSLLHSSHTLAYQLLQLCSPLSILCFGDEQSEILLRPTVKNKTQKRPKYWKINLGLDIQVSVLLTLTPELISRQSKMIEWQEDLELFRRICEMSFLGRNLSLFPTTTFQPIELFSELVRLFNEQKLNTTEYIWRMQKYDTRTEPINPHRC